MKSTLRCCTVILALLAAWPAAAQTGPNKITYQRFDWQIYRSPHFDIHYYPEEEAFLEQMVSFAESAYLQISEALDHQLSERVPLIYYKTHPEFQQTNITLSLIPDAVGAFAEPFQNRMVLPIDDAPDQVYKLLTHELVHIFEYDILFDSSLGRAVRSNPPLWIMEGLASYLAKDETSFDQMVIRDAVVNAIVPRLQQLNGLSFLTYRFGNAIFAFMEERWGKDGVRNFVFEYRKVLLTGNIGKAIKEATGLEVDDFNREFQKYLRKRYLPALLEKEDPAAYGREIGFDRPGTFTFAPTVSPGGELIAVLANRKLELDLYVMSGSDGAPLRNLTRGMTNDYAYLVAEVFEGQRDLAWSPVEDTVAVFARKENRRLLLLFDARTGKRKRMIEMRDLALQASPSFSSDGRRVAFSANQAGVYDIFSYDLETGEITNHTDDPFVDTNPDWSPDGTEILYNRRIGAYQKVFTVDTSESSRKTQLTFGESSDIMPSWSRDSRTVYYSSDAGGGLFNLFALDLKSAGLRQLTDVITGAFSPVELDTLGDQTVLVFTSYYQGRYRLYRMEVDRPVAEIPSSQRDLTLVELEPFRPTLNLTLDENEKSKYKRRYQVESPSLEIGVTDDGTFLGNSYISLSDTLGDRRWIFSLASVSTFSRLDIYHLDLARRINFIYHGYQYEDFFFLPVAVSGNVLVVDRLEARTSGLDFGIQVPFNSRYAWEVSVGASDSSVPVFETFPSNQAVGSRIVDRDFQSANLSSFFTGDTTRFLPWGPFHGQRFRIGTHWSPEIGGDGGTILEHRMDYRKYFKMSRRSSVAWRLFGISSDASDTAFRRFYSIGGLNQLRGYDYRDFVGDRAFFANLEIRFPLVDRLQLPWGSFSSIRGVIFFDIGGAYFQGGEYYDPITSTFVQRCPDPGLMGCDETGYVDQFSNPRQPWDFWNGDMDRLENGVASYGAGLNVRLGFLELNWVFSRRTDLSSDDTKWRSAFYIGNKF